jgi:hypothetical protein
MDQNGRNPILEPKVKHGAAPEDLRFDHAQPPGKELLPFPRLAREPPAVFVLLTLHADYVAPVTISR